MVGICYRLGWLKRCSLFLIVWGLCACGTSQKAKVVDVESKRLDVLQDSLLCLQRSAWFVDKFVHGQGIVRFRWAEYDTGKPSDPATGKPPIKHEGEAQVGWNAGQFLHKEGADSSRTTKGSKKLLQVEENSRTVEEKKTERASPIKDFWLTAVVLLFFIVLVYAMRRFLVQHRRW